MATFHCASSSSLLCRAEIPQKTYASRRQPVPAISRPPPSSSFSPSPLSFSTPSLLLPPTVRSRLSATPSPSSPTDREEVFFDGGPHIGDLIANLVFGLSLLWLPLTLASVFRALFLRYRFTNLRVTVMSGLTGSDRKDFSYKVIKDVKYVPRFVGEWGDVVITLSDGTQVELKSVPKFREIAQYCLERAGKEKEKEKEERFKGKGIARV